MCLLWMKLQTFSVILNFLSHHPYNVNKGIVSCLQHQAKAFSSDMAAYQKERISLRHDLHRNNYSECITSPPRYLDRRMEDETQKLTTLCQRSSRKESKGYVVHMTSRQYSQVAQFSKGISSMSSYQENSTWSRIVHTPSVAVVVKYTKVRYATH